MEALQSLLPRIGFSDELMRAISRIVTREVGLPVSLKKENILSLNFRDVSNSLPKEGIFVLLSLSPLPQKMFLELDPLLAFLMIDRLLGGPGDVPTFKRSLTDIEEAVLSYLFLKILSEIFERCGRSARVHFRLEGFESSSEAVTRSLSEKDFSVVTCYRIQVGERSGYVRLFLPSLFAEKVFLDPVEGMAASVESALSERDLYYYAARLWNLGFLSTSLWAEVGRTTLLGGDFQDLAAGDVVLFDTTQVCVEEGRVLGTLPLRVGKGEKGSFRGQILPDEGCLKVQLEGMEMSGGL